MLTAEELNNGLEQASKYIGMVKPIGAVLDKNINMEARNLLSKAIAILIEAKKELKQ